MPETIIFPNPDKADSEGLLAYGGDLSVNTLITAYSQGIFPWYSEGQPIFWWSPDPRMVLFLDKYKVSKSLLQKLKKKNFAISIDTCFEEIIQNCASVNRKDQTGTWITNEMTDAYINLYKNGYAHSVGVFTDNILVGGLYGVSLGKAFFGESMFHIMTDTSKIALYFLVQKLKEWNFHFIDAQQVTIHMKSIGADEVARSKFLVLLKEALKYETKQGKWSI